MAWADAAEGADAAIQRILLQRLQAQHYADAQRQQQFENTRQLGADKRSQQQIDQAGELTRMQRIDQQRQIDSEIAARTSAAGEKQIADARAGRETFSPGQVVDANAPNSPVSGWEKAGVQIGTAIPPVAPRLYTSPEDTQGTPGRTSGRAGYLLTPTPTQKKEQAAETAKTDAEARQEARDKAQGDYQTGMLDVARQNARTNATKPPAVQLITTVGDDGKPTQQFVPKTAGQTYAKPAGAVVENRLASAQAVQQTGQDLINKLSDPKYTATLGPTLGRYSKLQDFIGNPPPEYADLAGQIESYALANMGVHGMRSSQGAAQISALLNQRHTPESLAATIRGLNSFSEHFLQNEGRGTAAPASTTKPTVADLLKKYGGAP